MRRIVYLDDVIHEIAKQYKAHNELVPIWLDLAYIPKAGQTNIYSNMVEEKAELSKLNELTVQTDSVLEDIKADIEDLDTFFDNDYFSGNNDAMFKKKDVLVIIDKHISGKESE